MNRKEQSLEPLAISIETPDILLGHIIGQHAKSYTLIVCSNRETFLDDLYAATSTPAEDVGIAIDAGERSIHISEELPRPLSNPATLRIIAASRNTKLIFTPTLPILRAFLASYGFEKHDKARSQHSQGAIPRESNLIIWQIASLHHETTEWSAQGLTRTLACALDAANSADERLVIVESATPHISAGNAQASEVAEHIWLRRVPLLSASIPYGVADRALSGHLIPIQSIVARWCRIVVYDADAEPEW